MSRSSFYGLVIVATLCGWIWIGYTGNCGGVDVCLFKYITGIPCPACETTHTVHSLLEGDWSKALQGNLLGFVCLPALVVAPFWGVADWLMRRTSFYACYKWVDGVLRHKTCFVIFMMIMVANWIWTLSHIY